MANQGDGSYSRSHSASRKIRLNRSATWRKREVSKADETGIPVKRSLAERLGKKVEVDKAPKSDAEKAATSTGEIRVKTLEEIRQEKANRQGGTPAQLQAEGPCKTQERSMEARPSQAVCNSAFSQAPPLRKHRASEEGEQNADGFPAKRKVQGENNTQSLLSPPVAGKVKLEEPAQIIKPLEETHVKTMEEVEREKALQIQQREESVPAPPAPPVPAPTQRRLIRIPKLIAPGKEDKIDVASSTSVPACTPARQRKAAEMCCSAAGATADAMEKPPAKTAAVAVAPARPEDTLVTTAEAETPAESPDLRLRCWAESVAQSEDSSSASVSPGVTLKTQQLCSTEAGKAPISAEDDLEKLMLELSGEELEAGLDLEPGKDVDELLQELSDMIESIN